VIRFRDVDKSFNGLTVLKGINFEVKRLEVVALSGPSGSGKTTLLRLVSGLLKPDRGAIEVGSNRIGYIFQDHRLLPWRTAEDNISLVLKAAGNSRAEAREKARSWLDRMGLAGFYNYYPGQLSGGMLQRVSIARAFAIEPEIMLMDEPFSSLDADLADSLLRDLKQVLRQHKATVVFVTHDFVEALNIADRLFYLSSAGLTETPLTDKESMLREYVNRRIADLHSDVLSL
jgi:NitT/TauT family transport system ATP-binding protein